MITFLIQAEQNEEDTLNHIPIHDFSFTLIEAIKYNNWYYGESKFRYELKESELFSRYNLSTTIPVGSVEFVQSYIKQIQPDYIVKPINIPDQLMDFNFLGRKVIKNSIHNINSNVMNFIKDNSKIKGIAEFVPTNDLKVFIRNNNLKEYIVSDVIDIKSEWRGFVYNNKLIDIRNYSGGFDIFPNIEAVNKMIKTYTNCPPAYTIDVAVTDKGTYLIECHNFFSCGLYGFADYKSLPNMLIKAFRWQLENIMKQ